MPDDSVIEDLRAALTNDGLQFLIDTRLQHFRHPQLAEALEFWRKRTGPDGIPVRRDFTPQTMRAFLDRVALFEGVKQPTGASRLRARLTGREFARSYAEMSGKYIDEIVPERYRARWNLIWNAVVGFRRPFRMVQVPEAFNRKHSIVEYLLAPLLDDAGELNQVLMVCNFEFGVPWETVQAEEAEYLDQPPAAARMR